MVGSLFIMWDLADLVCMRAIGFEGVKKGCFAISRQSLNLLTIQEYSMVLYNVPQYTLLCWKICSGGEEAWGFTPVAHMACALNYFLRQSNSPEPVATCSRETRPKPFFGLIGLV